MSTLRLILIDPRVDDPKLFFVLGRGLQAFSALIRRSKKECGSPVLPARAEDDSIEINAQPGPRPGFVLRFNSEA
jgi:hypothetical protein